MPTALPRAKPPAAEPDALAPARRRFGWIIRLGLSAAVMSWLLWQIPWEPILRTLAGVNLGMGVLALSLYCAAQIVSSLRWRLLAQPLGFSETLARFTGLYFVGMFFNLFLPTSMGGDVVRAWRLAGSAERRWRAAASVVGERLSGLFALMIMACFAALFARAVVPEWAIAGVWMVTLAGGGACLLLPILKRRSRKLESLSEGLRLSHLQRGRWWAALGLSFAVQFASVTQVWLLGCGLGLAAPLLAYAVVVPLVTLATLLPLSLNGMGIREASLVVLLAAAGVDAAGALALGVCWFAMLLSAGLIGGLVFALGGAAVQPGESKHGRLGGSADQGRTRQPAAAA